jgi:hypothetical protein
VSKGVVPRVVWLVVLRVHLLGPITILVYIKAGRVDTCSTGHMTNTRGFTCRVLLSCMTDIGMG